jgi:hypothetical protein
MWSCKPVGMRAAGARPARKKKPSSARPGRAASGVANLMYAARTLWLGLGLYEFIYTVFPIGPIYAGCYIRNSENTYSTRMGE